jgi:hypothetical protein
MFEPVVVQMSMLVAWYLTVSRYCRVKGLRSLVGSAILIFGFIFFNKMNEAEWFLPYLFIVAVYYNDKRESWIRNEIS